MNELEATEGQTEHDTAWHVKDIDVAANQLGTDIQIGLKHEEAQSRLEKFGRNILEKRAGTSPLIMFFRQFLEPLVLLLIGAAIVSGLTGEITDAIVIGVILIFNSVLGFLQEYRAQRALEALREMSEPIARVIRDGEPVEVPADQIVPGDLLLLETGMRVVADARVLSETNLSVNEAALTGEAYPVKKSPAAIENADAPLGDRRCMVYAGTIIAQGRGRALVTDTGMRTELGAIAEMLQEAGEVTTPLQKRLRTVGTMLVWLVLGICALVFAVGLLTEKSTSLQEMLMTAISLAVAAVPEGLPAVITIALALGAQKMVACNALIRRLPAVETLGSITVIATDKTGTLTEGEMRPVRLYTAAGELPVTYGEYSLDAGEDSYEWLLSVMGLCNDAYLPVENAMPNYEKSVGMPTEIALLGAVITAGIAVEQLKTDNPRIAEIPFDADRKRMTTIHEMLGSGEIVAMLKGAPDRVLALSTKYRAGGAEQDMTPAQAAAIEAKILEFSKQGLRLLAAGYRRLNNVPDEVKAHDIEHDFVFAGMVALQDPPRPEVADAVRKAKDAGIRLVMVTGDYAVTAASIADQIGLRDRDGRVISGSELGEMTAEQLTQEAASIDVYARVSPADKVKVVQAWQNVGELVAVTGDGVNDAAALNRADIGIAMGQVGTEVAKDAADMVLLDDNFSTIINAIEQGRVIYDNIRKFIRYLLSTNMGEVLTIFFAILLGWPLPLVPVQILWINLITDGLPALALGFEPAEGDVMKRPARDPNESLFARGMIFNILWTGFMMAFIVLGLYWWRGFGAENLVEDRTLAFFVLAGLQLANVLSVRKERELVFGRGFWSNRHVLWAVVLGCAGQLAVTYVPFLQGVFKTKGLTLVDLALAIGACVFFFFFSEFVNYLEILRNRRIAALDAEREQRRHVAA